MTTYESVQVAMAGGVDPAYPRGGSAALTTLLADSSTRQDATGGPYDAVVIARLLADQVGRLDVTGGPVVANLIAQLKADVLGRLDATGAVLVGRFIAISAVYRNADRITLAGVATDLAGKPLRQVQIQFIGETVQQHFFGGATDLNGIYLAYLEVGDTYAAYAYTAGTGIVWKLDHEDASNPNTTTLVFRQVSKRGGFGEGIFLQGGT